MGTTLHKMSSSIVTITATGKAVVSEMPPFCGCCSDCFECCKAINHPAMAVGEIAEAAGGSACGAFCSFHFTQCMLGPPCAHWMHGCGAAVRLRQQHGLEANACALCWAHWCCSMCAKTQELRLIKMVRDARKQALEQRRPMRQTMAPVIMMAPPVMMAPARRMATPPRTFPLPPAQQWLRAPPAATQPAQQTVVPPAMREEGETSASTT